MEDDPQGPPRRFGSSEQLRRAITERTMRGDASSSFERLKERAEGSIRNGEYERAAADYHLLLADSILARDADMHIEASLRLAGVYHKLGDDLQGVEYIMRAIAVRDTSGTDFDIEKFLEEELQRWQDEG